MVLGLRSKNRKGTSVQVDYLIHVQEIKPWPPSKSLKSVQAVLLQWENGDQTYGSFTSGVGDGKVEFSESFRLPVTLCRESSRKGTAHDSFQKNILEFNLYEPRKDKPTKGQLLGSSLINLADYGIIKHAIAISIPMSFKKSSRSTVQAIINVTIQPCDTDNTNLSKEVSLDKDGSECVSEVTNEGNYEESEIALFTDDDDDVSSHSSRTVSTCAVESSRGGSPGQYDKNGSGSANIVTGKMNGEPTLSSDVVPANPVVKSASEAFKHLNGASSSSSAVYLSLNLQNPINDFVAKVPSSDVCNQVCENTIHMDSEQSEKNWESYKNAGKHDNNGLEGATTSSSHGGLKEKKDKEEQQNNGQDQEYFKIRKHDLEENLVGKLYQDTTRKQVKLRSNTLAHNRTATGVHCNTRREKLKHLKSVQLQFGSTESDEPFSNNQLTERVKKIDSTGNDQKGILSCTPSQREETKSSENKFELKSDIEIFSEELTEVSAAEVALYTVVDKHDYTGQRVHLVEKAKELAHPVNNEKGGVSYGPGEIEDTKNKLLIDKVELESKVEMLKEELMEVAALEAGLYSVVAEHGSSTAKVHAPARRLTRFYLGACKAGSWAKRASAARAILSGLVLVSKSCGNDVPRLTFWLSNAIMLRVIVSQAVDKLQLSTAPITDNKDDQKGCFESSPCGESNETERSDEWDETLTYIVALEKVEAWIFSRIVESIWWQTLTPHMQSTAVKGSSSRKAYSRRLGLGDQEQGNFAIDLWKRAFKDACERLCPIRAGGHECGCLPVLARLVMEQLVGRLDVAMFNAVLRESAEDMPTDPVSDPISDLKVLPIPAGKSSFGAGAKLKNAVGNWSRWLTDLFGIDDNDSPEDKDDVDDNHLESKTYFKAFCLLNALSDLMMLPFEMLADRSTRKEICPTFGAPLVRRVLNNFIPDEFNPYPIPEEILEALDSEDFEEAKEEYITSFPCSATPTVYLPPSATSLTNIIGEVGNQTLQRSTSSVLKKSYTSDDELDELDSPMTSIIIDSSRASPSSTALNWTQKGKVGRKGVRYQLLREVWRDGE